GMRTAVAGVALSQPMMGAGGFMHGNGPGMMGRGGGYSGPAGYLDDLKAILGITAAEEAAWNAYADAVKSSAEQMQGVHQTMYEAMGTATWQERRDMMNRMFDVRQEAFEKVHAAADKLLPSLDASQQQKAKTRLPGLAGPGYGMMGGQFRSP
ncbi:MAG: Spy/CpxP family protein refolding chaperone, partial [Burkholderiales bacterium]